MAITPLAPQPPSGQAVSIRLAPTEPQGRTSPGTGHRLPEVRLSQMTPASRKAPGLPEEKPRNEAYRQPRSDDVLLFKHLPEGAVAHGRGFFKL